MSPGRRRIAINTAIFAAATALSRVAGLAREVVQAAFFNTSAAASAFTLASQVPNLFSNLFSQAALSAAFVPVFTDLLQQGRKREAFKLASELFWLILVGLGALTIVWIAAAGLVVPVFTGGNIPNALTAGLSRVLFPVVLLLSLTGLLVGILQSYDQFTIPAIAPAVWNLVIVVLLVVLHPRFHGDNAVYAYAIAWLLATVVQFLMIAFALRKVEFRPSFSLNWRDPRVRQVGLLFLPVTLSIGIINLDIFLNAGFGSLVSSHAPSAINDAFRIYMLPQGIFSVAVSTVLFPTLSRMANRRDVGGMRADGRQRNPPDQPPADPVGGADGGPGDPDHAARLPARDLHRVLHRPGGDRAVLVRVEPSVRRRQPAPQPDLLRAPAALDSDQARGAQHDRRRHRVGRAVQAAGHRRAGDRHGRGQRRHDRRCSSGGCGPGSTAASRARRRR